MSRKTVKDWTKPARILTGVMVPPLLALPVAVVLHLLGYTALAASIALPGVAILVVLLLAITLWRHLGWPEEVMHRGGEGILYPRKGEWFRTRRRPETALQSYLDRRRY